MTTVSVNTPKKNLYPLYVLWQFIRNRPVIFILASLFPLISQGIALYAGLIQQAFFNQMQVSTVEHHPQFLPLFWSLLGLFVVVNFMIYGVSFLGSLGGISAVASAALIVRRNILHRILQLPGARAITSSIGEAVGNFRDDPDPPTMLFVSLSMMVAQTAFAIVACIILLRTNTLITLLVIAPLLCIIMLSQVAKGKMLAYRKASRETASQLTGVINESFDAIQAIQVARAESGMLTHIDDISTQRMVMAVKDSAFTSIMNTLMSGSTSLSTAFILIIAALTVHSNTLHAGDLILFIVYLNFINGLVLGIGNFRTQYIQAGISLDRMQRMMQDAPQQQLVAPSPSHRTTKKVQVLDQTPLPSEDSLITLTTRDLTYHFPQTTKGIQGINMIVRRGTLTVITGRIGAGKTTCLQVLLGLLPKDNGEIRWNGSVVSSPNAFFTPPRSSYTPQIPHLLSGTIKENILLGLAEDQVDLQKAVRTAVLENDLALLERGLDTTIGAKGVKLSGGQAQRVAAARMLARPAELYVFDDLSSALDVETENRLWDRLFTNKSQSTFLAVSHRRDILQRADHIVVLKEGKIEAEGDFSTLLKNSSEMQYLSERFIEA